MNRVAVIIVTLAVVAGSVPVAGALAGGATGQTSGEEPGAAFAGMVGVQQAEVDNEVAQRSLAKQFEKAASNDSKARVVAEQSEQLSERLAELEAEKQRLEQARENGSIGQGEYKARLATLGAEIRAVERQANQTADVAEELPEEALREHGANASEVRRIAQQANEAGGGEVAEAARSIAGDGVGNGLSGPPNGSARGPPEGAGPTGDGGPSGNDSSTDASLGNGNAAGENVAGQPEGAGSGNGSMAGGVSNSTNAPVNGSERGQNATGGSPDSPTPRSNTTGGYATAPGGDSAGNGTLGDGVGRENATTNATDPNNATDPDNATETVTGTPESTLGGNETTDSGTAETAVLVTGTGSTLDRTAVQSAAAATPGV